MGVLKCHRLTPPNKMVESGQIVMTFRQLSQIWRELALHYFPVDCFGGFQFDGDGQTILMDSRLSEIWRELALHYFLADCFGIVFFSESLLKSIRKVSITATCRLE
jgi:hypothetical protein